MDVQGGGGNGLVVLRGTGAARVAVAAPRLMPKALFGGRAHSIENAVTASGMIALRVPMTVWPLEFVVIDRTRRRNPFGVVGLTPATITSLSMIGGLPSGPAAGGGGRAGLA